MLTISDDIERRKAEVLKWLKVNGVKISNKLPDFATDEEAAKFIVFMEKLTRSLGKG